MSWFNSFYHISKCFTLQNHLSFEFIFEALNFIVISLKQNFTIKVMQELQKLLY